MNKEIQKYIDARITAILEKAIISGVKHTLLTGVVRKQEY